MHNDKSCKTIQVLKFKTKTEKPTQKIAIDRNFKRLNKNIVTNMNF